MNPLHSLTGATVLIRKDGYVVEREEALGRCFFRIERKSIINECGNAVGQ